MFILSHDIVLMELPGEVSLAFAVAGCPGNCPGCSWKEKSLGSQVEMTMDAFQDLLLSVKGLVTCVLFLGGEWNSDLNTFLDVSREYGFKTGLYTGRNNVSKETEERLTYLKTGEYIAELGGLESPNTNQILRNLETGEVLNGLFRRDSQ